jgi:hypothetical protein
VLIRVRTGGDEQSPVAKLKDLCGRLKFILGSRAWGKLGSRHGEKSEDPGGFAYDGERT